MATQQISLTGPDLLSALFSQEFYDTVVIPLTAKYNQWPVL